MEDKLLPKAEFLLDAWQRSSPSEAQKDWDRRFKQRQDPIEAARKTAFEKLSKTGSLSIEPLRPLKRLRDA